MSILYKTTTTLEKSYWSIKLFHSPTIICLLFFNLLFLDTNAQWTTISNPSYYHQYAIDVVSENVIYVGGYGGSLVKSTNGGNTFSYIPFGNSDWVMDIQFISETKGWICGISGNSNPGHLLSTNDGGNTWTTLHDTNSYYSMQWLNKDTGYVGCTDGKFIKTIDGGNNWSTVPLASTGTITNIQFFDYNNGFLITTNNELFKTTNAGNSWTKSIHYGIEAIHFKDMNNGYMVNYYGKIGTTTDGGATFSLVQSPYNFQLRDIYFVNNNVGYIVGGLDCSTTNCIQAPVILTTIDGGITWVDETHPYVNQDKGFYQIDVTPSGIPFICGSNTIIMTSQAIVSDNSMESLANNYFEIYPNPSNGNVNITSSVKISEIEIFDMQGKLISKINSNSLLTSFNISALEKGFYIVKGKSKNGKIQFSKPLIKTE